MKKIAAIGAFGLLASCLFAQGLNPGPQTKDDWEEINFEFNSSVLSDGYPSLLRLAELLNRHRDFRVKVTGHTDHIGSVPYNDRLARARAETVKAFLVKYGATPDQIATDSEGKSAPEVQGQTDEGRFINRRVTVVVTDGTGKVINEGSIPGLLAAPQPAAPPAPQQPDCCSEVLKQLGKLDQILAALNDLKGENAKLQGQIDDLRKQHAGLEAQVNGLPKPLTEAQTQTIAHSEALGAVDEAQRRNKKFSILGLNVGPTFGPGRTGDYTVSGRAQFFSPFGGDGTHAVQAQGEYMYYPGRQEGQFDIGLVNRWNSIQAGAFASFKYLQLKQYQSGGALGQAAFMLDYVFNRGRVGVFGTRGFKNYAVLNSVTLAPGAFLETYARVVNQYGVNYLYGLWGDSYLQGNLGYLQRREGTGGDRPGAMLRFVQPLTDRVSFTAEAGYNETLLNTKDSGRLVFGLEFGSSIKPKEYANIKTPVPMDVPRVRYEFGTRRVGSSPPVADAGPDQLNQGAGTVTLNGSSSYDPLGLTLTYAWSQVSGPAVTLSNPTDAVTTFTAASGKSYVFRLTVKNTDGLQSSDTVAVSTSTPAQAAIVQFGASPATIQAGQSATLSWTISNATGASISPDPGTVDPRTGSVSVTPAQTTTYTLTATGASGNTTAQVTVTVTPAAAGNPQVVRFEASPLTIQPGGQSTLSWTTAGATSVAISGIGNVNPNGSTTVSPAQTTTYVLTASTADGKSVTAPITVTVASASIPQIATFVATPQNIDPGGSTKLCWQVTNANSVEIQGVGGNLNPNDCVTVSPTQTTTYTLTATNLSGKIQADVTVNVGQVRILSFTSDPIFSTRAGDPVTLTWQTDHALSVVLIGNDLPPVSSLPPNGSYVIHPISNATYTLTAYGPGGQTVSVTISVFVR